MVGTTRSRQELKRLADAGILKLGHGERAPPYCPVRDPVFGPGVEQITDPEGVSSEVISLEDERRLERIGISWVTGPNLLQVCVVGQEHISRQSERKISQASIKPVNLLNSIGIEWLRGPLIRARTSQGDVTRGPVSRNLARINLMGQITVDD